MAPTPRLPSWFVMLAITSGTIAAFVLGLVLSAPYATSHRHTGQPHPPQITDPGWPHLHNWFWAAVVAAAALCVLTALFRRIDRG